MSEPETRFASIPVSTIRPPTKRLSIADLFVITLGAAIAIWFLQQPATFLDNRAVILVNVVMSPLYGLSIAALILATYRLLRASPPFATQPGHWLLLIVGTMFAGIGLLAKAAPAAFSSEHPESWGVLAVIGLVLAGWLLASSLILIYRCGRDASEDQPRNWRVVFQWLVIAPITVFFGGCLLPGGLGVFVLPMLMIFLPPIVLYVALLRAIALDLWRKDYRDHWHWLGVAAFLGLPTHIALLVLAEHLQSTR